MKYTKTLAAVTVAATLLLTAQSALALDFKALELKVSNNINNDCGQPDGYDPVWSCYRNEFKPEAGQEALKAHPTIYVRTGISSALLPYALFHGVGEFVIGNYSDQELLAVFNPLPVIKESVGVRSTAANAFAMWATGGSVTPAQMEFFKSAFAK